MERRRYNAVADKQTCHHDDQTEGSQGSERCSRPRWGREAQKKKGAPEFGEIMMRLDHHFVVTVYLGVVSRPNPPQHSSHQVTEDQRQNKE